MADQAKRKSDYAYVKQVIERLGRERITDWLTVESFKESNTSDFLKSLRKQCKKSTVPEETELGDACKALMSKWQAACQVNKQKEPADRAAKSQGAAVVGTSPVAAAMTKRLRWSVPFGDDTSTAIMVSGKKQKMVRRCSKQPFPKHLIG